MAKEAMIHARTEIELKKEVEKIFAASGQFHARPHQGQGD